MLDLPYEVKHNNLMSKYFDDITCETCNTLHERVPVDYDEDSGDGYAVLEVTPCSDSECGLLLCDCCEQFCCTFCDETYCLEHRTIWYQGTPEKLELCRACSAEHTVESLTEATCLLAIPAQSETRHSVPNHLEVA